MKKEFELSAKLNTADFDRSVQEMVKKLKDVSTPIGAMQQQTAQRMQQQGLGGMSAPSMEAYQKATQNSRREMDQMISEQAKGQEKLGKFIAQRTESIKNLIREQQKLVAGSKEELEIREKIQKAEANQQQLKEAYRQRDAMLNQALDARQQMQDQSAADIKARNPEGWGRVGRFAKQGMYGAAGKEAFNTIGGWGGVGSILATVGKVGEAGSEAYRDFSKGAVRTEGSMGSAVSGTMGRQVGDIYARRSAFEQNFAPERQRAAQQSLDTLRANQNADKMSTGFGLLKNIGGGIAGGAALGGAVGMLGGPIGAGAGALIGGGLGLGKGLLDIMGDERKRSMVLSPFSDTAKKRYGSILAEDMVNDYTKSYEGQKQQNPFKTAAVGEYEQNWNRNLQSQRAMGLTNEGFYGKNGFLNRNIEAGFTPEMGLEMSGNILGAGGSTRMSRDSAFGNQLARGADLTNAGQVLGTLSGGLGGSEATKQATVKILAEGMKLGLDDSKFAEENRKFAQMTAEIVARSGAKGEGDFERVSGKFGAFVGENTGAGLGAAKTAYEQYQQISQTTSGPRGVMRAAGFMADKDLNKLSTMTKQALMQVPESDLNEENPLVQAAAKEAGIDVKDVVSKVTNVNQGSVSRFKEADTIRDRLKARMKEEGKERISEEDLKTLPEDMKADFNKLTTFQTTELGYQGQRETTARALGTINPAQTMEDKQRQRENIIQDKTTSIDRTGRMEDVTVKAMAADSKVVLDNFNEMAPAMKKAAESTAAWTREVRENAAAMQQVLEAARANKNADTLKAVEDLMKRMSTPGNQQQSGKKSN
jgi:hypothetical protein